MIGRLHHQHRQPLNRLSRLIYAPATAIFANLAPSVEALFQEVYAELDRKTSSYGSRDVECEVCVIFWW